MGDAVNYISINSGVTSTAYKGMKAGRRIRFTNEDREIMDKIQYVEKSSSRTFLFQENNTISYKNEYGTFDIFAISPEYRYVEILTMTSGRFLNQKDITDYRKSVVLGRLVYEALFKGGEEAVDKYVKVSGVPFKVVGVFDDPGQDRDVRRIYIPVSTAQRVFNMGNNIRNVCLMLGEADIQQSHQVVEDVKQQMSEQA